MTDLLSGPLTIAIAEDQALLRIGMTQVLKSAGHSVVSETIDGKTTLENVLSMRPAVILLKKDLPGCNAVSCCQTIRRTLGNDTAIIILLSSPTDLWEALDSGADGYALRETCVELLPYAVRTVNSGLGWIGPNISQYLVKGKGTALLRSAADRFANSPTLAVLSAREQEVFGLLADGCTNRHIAQALGLKLETVKVHVRSILRKLKAQSRSQAISLVLKAGSRGA